MILQGLTPGSHLDFGARIYDSRIGRFLSVDEMADKYASSSPYSAFRNSPILFIDKNGNEWVNAFDAIVAEKEKALLENPNSRRLQRQLEDAKDKQAKVNEIINNVKENDEALYNYINNLTVKDVKTGEIINVKVYVGIDYLSGRDEKEEARTNYADRDKKGIRRYIEYNGLEGKYDVTFAPINKNDEIGFDITLFFTPDYADITLANEAGDVMFRIEFPEASFNSGTDFGKTYEDYVRKGSAGYYSNKVEDKYKERRKEKQKTGKNPETNPYPMKND